MQTAARRRLLFVYVFVVALLAWWPWNFWLIFLGSAYAHSLQSRYATRLSGPGARESLISLAEVVEQTALTRHDRDAARENLRIIRGEHLGNPPRDAGVNAALPPHDAVGKRRIEGG
jgi:hypothetical protein